MLAINWVVLESWLTLPPPIVLMPNMILQIVGHSCVDGVWQHIRHRQGPPSDYRGRWI